MISRPTILPTQYYIFDLVKITLRSDQYDSICSNDDKIEKPTTFRAQFLRYSVP